MIYDTLIVFIMLQHFKASDDDVSARKKMLFYLVRFALAYLNIPYRSDFIQISTKLNTRHCQSRGALIYE